MVFNGARHAWNSLRQGAVEFMDAGNLFYWRLKYWIAKQRILTAAFFANLLFAGLLIPGSVLAEDRPPPSDRPMQVSLGLFLMDVLAIDDSKQTVTIDFGISATWFDPRLEGKAGQVIPLEDAWAPNLQLMADKDIRRTRPEVLHVLEGGKVVYLQRFIGEMWHTSDLRDFPFDDQEISIRLVTPLHSPEAIELIEDAERTGQSAEWSLVGWEYEDGKWSSAPYYFAPAKKTISGAAYTFKVHRERGFYVWKVLVPLSLVVLMAWAVFWIDASNSGSQISVGYTAILTLVAYRFLIGNMVPSISYLTRLDRFILGVSILVFFVLAEAIWTGRLVAEGKLFRAVHVDRYGRWIFICLFILILLFAFVF